MTLSTRLLTRVSIACAATALALSACSSKHTAENPATPTPPTSASAPAAESTETTPTPGKWTLEDLKVGAKVPKEDLERLFPKWEIPQPPATLTEFTEQGAKDAGQYYSRLTEIAFHFKDSSLFNRIDEGRCSNCDSLRNDAAQNVEPRGYLLESRPEVTSAKKHPDLENVYEIRMDLTYPISIRLDEKNEAITSMDPNDKQTVFHYVTYADSHWTPIYVMLDRSHL